ncbi:MAG: hypothetical protein RIS94_2011 [Pseudomonadota bacterium]|jgi:HlyD family secretion protein
MMIGQRIWRWRWTLGLVGLLALGLGYAFWPRPVAVDLGTVSRGPMMVGITDDGVTRAKELYVVSAPVTGYLSRIELEAGDKVGKGTLITRMTGRPSAPLDARTRAEMKGALAAAQAGAASSDATLAQARRDLERAEALARRGFLPRAQLEAARTRVSAGEAARARSRAEIAQMQARLGPSGLASSAGVDVRAPVSGSVLSVITESAGIVAEGTPLMSIGDAGRTELVVDLLSREAVRARVGDPVEITQWGGDGPLHGHVARIEPFGRLKVSALGIEEQRVNLIVYFDAASAAEAARLGHGYQVDATIVLWRRPDVLRVPIGALFRGADGGWQAFVPDKGRARSRAVKVGHINDAVAEVLGGLKPGEAVILDPGNTISEGARVKQR